MQKTVLHITRAESLQQATEGALRAAQGHLGIGVTQQNLDGTYSIEIVLVPNRDQRVYNPQGGVERFADGTAVTREREF